MKSILRVASAILLLVLLIVCINTQTALAIVRQIGTIITDLCHGQCNIADIKTLAELVVQAIENLFHSILAAIAWLIARIS